MLSVSSDILYKNPCSWVSWTISNLCLWSSSALIADKQLKEENDTSSTGSQMAKQVTMRGNIKHNLLFSALREILSEISRKMRERREEYENMTRLGIFVLLQAAPGDRSV